MKMVYRYCPQCGKVKSVPEQYKDDKFFKRCATCKSGFFKQQELVDIPETFEKMQEIGRSYSDKHCYTSNQMLYVYEEYIQHNLNCQNFDKERFYKAIKYHDEAEYRAVTAPPKPKCPNCGSYRVHPISTTKRVISTATLGLASGTIGKSYECEECKYKW
jgi:hypothetical protein